MGKVAVITGASRGIGRATALLFARRGYNLAICCRSNSGLLHEVYEQVSSMGSDCLAFTGDMGSPDESHSFFNEIRQTYSRIDVLINNAGISMTGLFQDVTVRDWQLMLDSNLSSVFFCSQEAARVMLGQGAGSIVNVSSVWGSAGASCEAAYSAAKGGVNSLTRALAKELAPSHIRVNAAAFGAIDTDMNRSLSEADRAALEEEISMGRMGSPEEAAALLLQIAEGPEYLTGQVITMDGAWI